MRELYEKIFKSIEDAENYVIPKDIKSWDKLKAHISFGKKIGWYYKEDEEFYKGEGIDPRKECPYSGIMIPTPDADCRTFNEDNCVVIIEDYPCEKCNPECDWVSLAQLIDNETLVEIFEIK